MAPTSSTCVLSIRPWKTRVDMVKILSLQIIQQVRSSWIPISSMHYNSKLTYIQVLFKSALRLESTSCGCSCLESFELHENISSVVHSDMPLRMVNTKALSTLLFPWSYLTEKAMAERSAQSQLPCQRKRGGIIIYDTAPLALHI